MGSLIRLRAGQLLPKHFVKAYKARCACSEDGPNISHILNDCLISLRWRHFTAAFLKVEIHNLQEALTSIPKGDIRTIKLDLALKDQLIFPLRTLHILIAG